MQQSHKAVAKVAQMELVGTRVCNGNLCVPSPHPGFDAVAEVVGYCCHKTW